MLDKGMNRDGIFLYAFLEAIMKKKKQGLWYRGNNKAKEKFSLFPFRIL